VEGEYFKTPTPTLLALPSIPKTIVSPFSFTLCVGGGNGKLPMSAEQGPSAAVLDDMVGAVDEWSGVARNTVKRKETRAGKLKSHFSVDTTHSE